jgi:hypothetical protein
MSPFAHVDASFMPTGYTPASAMPVTKRRTGAIGVDGLTTSRSALAIAPPSAHSANSRRGSTRSASPMTALTRQPTTNPSCTPLVSAACMNPDNPYSPTSAGTTADAENHSASAATSQIAMMATDASFDVARTIRSSAA